MTQKKNAAVVSRSGDSPWPLVRSDFRHRVRVMLPSTKSALNDAVHRLLEVAEEAGCLVGGHVDLEIALREALANALIHGNAFGPEKKIFLRCYAAPCSGLLIIVRDEGIGFNPELVPDPREAERMHLNHGRGLFLMRQLMDYVEFRKGGCEVVLYKSCQPK